MGGLADFGGIYKYSPGVRSSHSTSIENGGVGASRHCDLLPAGSIEERIVDWNEGRGYSLEIFDGEKTPPLKKAVATLELEPRGDMTEVMARFDYALKYGPLGALGDRLLFRRLFERGFDNLLSGLKHHVETGEEIGRGVKVQLAAVPA